MLLKDGISVTFERQNRRTRATFTLEHLRHDQLLDKHRAVDMLVDLSDACLDRLVKQVFSGVIERD